MQKGMNQTVAWLLAVFVSSAIFGLGGFVLSKYQPAGEEQHLSAKAHASEETHKTQPDTTEGKKKNVKSVESEHPKEPKSGGEVLRPDDLEHTNKPHH